IDLISVAYGPGLLGPLLIGVNAAKMLALTLKKPLIGVNHVEAHLFAPFMERDEEIPFPSIGVLLSGGHTAILKVNSFMDYQLIGQTVDDAIGEAFDKVAKMLQLPYPGGPEIERLAKEGDPLFYPFKGGKVKTNPYSFSLSGLKTKVLYTLSGQDQKLSNIKIPLITKQNIAASFQKAAFDDVVKKTLNACKEHDCTTVLFGGGVTNNRRLREMFYEADSSKNWVFPPFSLTLDNAAMIAGLGAHRYLATGKSDPLTLSPVTRIAFPKLL
ncbi:tRNA (adenosine(37)-N6)-threonylcarbamoyltransferase complex transferase subunit TsaD, partial [Chlamydiales bacterium]|nr:tRNA (adenosine(37)-N6)-threonylcarbamoyltransferase complex transferase subunit TsaD [Chlamydiales bacterium]